MNLFKRFFKDDFFSNVRKNNKKAIRTQISQNPDLAFKRCPNTGKTALHIAAENGLSDMCKYLVDEVNLPVDQVDNMDYTPMHYAAKGNYVDVVKILLERRADICNRSIDGATAFEVALLNRNFEAEAILREKSYVYQFGRAIEGNNSDTAMKIYDEANDPNIVNIQIRGVSPLIVATKNKNLCLVEFLVKHGAPLHFTSKNGNSALHLACQDSYLEMAATLIKGGSNVEAHNNIGFTPLHIAVQNNDFEMVKLLVKNGANINACSTMGLTPKSLAEIHGVEEILVLLNHFI